MTSTGDFMKELLNNLNFSRYLFIVIVENGFFINYICVITVKILGSKIDNVIKCSNVEINFFYKNFEIQKVTN